MLAAVVGVATGVWFCRRQLSAGEPFIDVRLFARPAFGLAYLQILLSTAVSSACLYLVSLRLQEGRGQSALDAGLAILPQAIAVAVGGILAPRLARRRPGSSIAGAGMGLQALGLAWAATDPEGLAAPLALVGLGTGVVATVSAARLFEVTLPDQSGQVSAVQEVAFALGAGLGVAVLANLGALVAAQSSPYLGFVTAMLTASGLAALTAVVPIVARVRARSGPDARPG